jgi:hypothetical protein
MFVDPAGDKSRGTFLVPLGTDAPRRMSGTAVRMCATAIFLSPALRDALSHRLLLWLGRHSFAVYLVHGTLLRTVGMWIVYGTSLDGYVPGGGLDEHGNRKDPQYLRPLSAGHKRIAMIVFIILTYLCAWAWVKYVDSACEAFTAWLERKVFVDEDEATGGKQGLAEKGYMNGYHQSSPRSNMINGHSSHINGHPSPGYKVPPP